MWAVDLIELDGGDLRLDPLEVRKATLTTIIAKTAAGLRFNEHAEEKVVFKHACKLGLEGITMRWQ
jgi:bifunctional non-homologous end joining protein LigD